MSTSQSLSHSLLSTWGRLRALLSAMRPKQWTKNATLFIAIIFSGHLFQFNEFERTVLAFLAFCLASSSIYLFNDLLDIEKDRQHPVKCKRPLASGQLPASWAVAAIVIILLVCTCLVLVIFTLPVDGAKDIYTNIGGSNILFALCVLTYLVLMVCYGIWLKHIVLIDIFVIACGFVIRVIAGALVTPVSISPWLYMVTCLLSLFLALSKRRNELVLLQGQASAHRQILKEYSIPMLDQMITVVATCTLMAYSLYTVEAPTGYHNIILTVPFVLYGLFRYLYLVYMRKDGGSPDEVLLRDRHMLITVVMCTVIILVVFYALPH
ncbi:decaprenyl-phosphate phosphoribosyltransferase [Ktedonospora formicarum]|uniref:Decaprenyl-phosphate phosphoribosyltransferase n=1 Tax=Ktedonospora formicarum TaxID=2778364 RepID=A0A8J3HZV3_9CHLR|nr:decaprenyl-phosphate phosphoribosyltransferase [Ktedonospora formicarum]GHO45031.1 decaprenyl-phosphate phosphoribosyltransferase [Ktedonospora formicarum]